MSACSEGSWAWQLVIAKGSNVSGAGPGRIICACAFELQFTLGNLQMDESHGRLAGKRLANAGGAQSTTANPAGKHRAVSRRTDRELTEPCCNVVALMGAPGRCGSGLRTELPSSLRHLEGSQALPLQASVFGHLSETLCVRLAAGSSPSFRSAAPTQGSSVKNSD